MPTPESLARQQIDQLLALAEESRRIVAEVERGLESARAVEVWLKLSWRLRQALLRAAFEGRL
jgi:hypothetical protein